MSSGLAGNRAMRGVRWDVFLPKQLQNNSACRRLQEALAAKLGRPPLEEPPPAVTKGS